MNKNTFVKFSLTLVSAAVLAACSSSGGGDDHAAKAKQQQEAVPKTEVAPKAEETAKTEVAPKAEETAKTEVAPKVEETAKTEETPKAEETAKTEETPKAEETAKTEETPKAEETVDTRTVVGHKFVQKTASSLQVGTGTNVSNDLSTSTTAMTLELEPSLDTIVVAIPSDKQGKQAYLEDFDFRKEDATDIANANIYGLTKLEHIYVGGNTKNGVDRPANADELTKTATMGKDSGIAVVYEKGRLNYTDYEGDDVLDPKVKRTQEFLKTIGTDTNNPTDVKGSVAEVYGYRTFAQGNSELGGNVNDEQVVIENAPFTHFDAATKTYSDGQLEHVQYGRVTSALHNVNQANFKDGNKLGNFGTQVAGYGYYGAEGTENHYFYRGIDSTAYSEKLAADLGNYYFGNKEGKLQYQGHAVTYGIDHNYNALNGIPNAIGYKQELVSGTHVAADVDLATKDVTGRLYDVWQAGNRDNLQPRDVDLVTFKGSLQNNGSIEGKATRADKAEGRLNANLFGSHAEELGGAIKSDDQAKHWGAVFGAKVQNTPFVPDVVTPEQEQPSTSWAESTDSNDKNSPIK